MKRANPEGLMKAIFAACLSLSLAACETVDPNLKTDIQKSRPICKTPKGCEIGWAAARRWVNDNAGFRILTYSPEYMETYTASDSAQLSARVSKEPRTDGSYEISAVIGCANLFGCVPSAAPTLLNFNTTVSAAIAAAEATP